MDRTLTWLHISDLHCGQPKFHYAANIYDAFYDHLGQWMKINGPIDIVLFSGDLVYSGQKEEYESLNKAFLDKLWDLFQQSNCNPELLAVPGNHDLARPNSSSLPIKYLSSVEFLDDELRNEIWSTKAGEPGGIKELINNIFREYVYWHDQSSYTCKSIRSGLLPGDFSFEREINNVSVGIVGLNTTAFQLSNKLGKGRLEIDSRQLSAICDNDAPKWLKKHDINILITHQPPGWLSEKSRRELNVEIAPPGKFLLHLCGHMHSAEYQNIQRGGGESVRLWQAPSLFGLETYGQGENTQRVHGYSIGRFQHTDAETESIRFWPYVATSGGFNGWRFVSDNVNYKLDGDGETLTENIGKHISYSPAALFKDDETKPIILFVDDLQEDRKYFRKIFSEKYHIELAESVDEAFHIAQEIENNNNKLSVVVTDHLMPQKKGVELLQIFKARFPDVVRIMITAYIDNDVLCDAINKGDINNILPKPLNVENAQAVLKSAVLQYQGAKERTEAVTFYRKTIKGTPRKDVQSDSLAIRSNMWMENYIYQLEKSLERIAGIVDYYLKGTFDPFNQLYALFGRQTDYMTLHRLSMKLGSCQKMIRVDLGIIAKEQRYLPVHRLLGELMRPDTKMQKITSMLPGYSDSINSSVMYYNVAAKSMGWPALAP